MKKSLFTLIVLSLCSLLAAQFIVWRNGQIVYQSEINEVDSITLYEYNLPDTPDEPDTPDTPDKPSEPKYIIVKAKVPSSWDDVTAWIWATDEEGREVRATRDGDWWLVTAHCEELNVIFKNGWGWNGDVNQTEEITGIRENTCYQLKQIGAQKATATAVDCPDITCNLEIEEDSIFLFLGETQEISYTLTPEYANDIFDVEFISSNEGVATVSADGLITAVSEGETKIIARVKDHEDICDTIVVNVKNAEVAANMRVYYEGCLSPYFPNFAQFTFEAYTGDVVYDIEEGSLTGTGLVVQLFQAVSYEVDYFPTCTKYSPFEIVNNEVGEIFEGGAVGVQIIEIQNGQQAGSLQTKDFKAQLIASGDKMIWALEGNFDGEILTFKLGGTPQHVVGGAFSKDGAESTNKYNGEETYDHAEVIYYGDINLLPVNIIEVILISKDNTSFADFICYGSLDNIESVYGKYTVDVRHEVGKMAKSAGVSKEEGYVFPSFVVRNYSQNGADYYLVDGGTLTIEEGKISFDLVSGNGSTFKTTYAGEFTVKSYDETYGAPKFNAPSFKASVAKNVQPLNYNPIKLSIVK